MPAGGKESFLLTAGLCFTFWHQQPFPEQDLPLSPSPPFCVPSLPVCPTPWVQSCKRSNLSSTSLPGALGKCHPFPLTSDPLSIKWDWTRLEIPNSNARQLTNKTAQVKSTSAGKNWQKGATPQPQPITAMQECRHRAAGSLGLRQARNLGFFKYAISQVINVD